MSTELLTPELKAKLVVPREQAIKLLRVQLSKAALMRDVRIRSVQDLDKARERKTEWTRFTTALLTQLFDSDDVAAEFNRLVGKLLPEFANLDQFIKHFNDETSQRIGKLQLILEYLTNAPEIVQGRLSSPELSFADDDSEMSMIAANSTETVKAESEVAQPAKPTKRPAAAALILHARDELLEEAAASFVTKLGFELVRIGEEPEGLGGAISTLSQHPQVGFAVLLAKADDVAAAQQASGLSAACPRAAFELGYCAGRIGAERVCVLHSGTGSPFRDEFGMFYVPFDPAEGWQLHLARQLRRAGIAVDLNRLC